MAQTDEITILRIGTDEAVRNIQDLRDNITALKAALNGLDIGSEEYNRVLMELNVNQNALKDAMHYTTTESKSAEEAMNGIAKGAAGLGNSYNALVARMKTLREEWRSTEDVARRNELGRQILEVNNQLKNLDKSTGSFKRNVGNYASALDGLKKGFKATAGSAGGVVKPVKKAKDAFQALSKTSAIAIFGIIAGAVAHLVSKLKENEAVTNAVKKAMQALKPITDIISGVIDKLAGFVAKVIDRFGELAGNSASTFSKIVAGAVGVGNVLLQYLLTPIRTIIGAFKGLGNIIKDVFTGQFKKIKDDATKAFSEIGDAFRKGFNFKENFDLGKEAGQKFLEGLTNGVKDKKNQEPVIEEVVDLFDEIQKAVENKIKADQNKLGSDILSLQRKFIESEIEKLKAAGKSEEEIVEEISSRLFGIRKKWSDIQARQAENDAAKASELKGIERLMVEDAENVTAEIDALWEEQFQNEMERTKRLKEARTELMYTIAGTASSVLGSVADIYESLSENDEKAAEETKGIRIASAVIDTISGAIAAYMSAQSLNVAGVPIGTIVGALNAATVIAAGTANIAKIRSTNVSKNAASSAASLASFSTPTVTASIPQTTIVKGATDEAVLNQMGQPARVYILQSDIEAAAKSSKARVSDSSFR